jgi:L,D-peptidoglycan transpeptidase YkuD (ErfK/YbiS/YcfS/YnhG family)
MDPMANPKASKPSLGRSKSNYGVLLRDGLSARNARCPADRNLGEANLRPHLLTRLYVTRAAQCDRRASPRGRLRAGGSIVPCAIGAAGIRRSKREGDGATPAGRFACLGGFFEAAVAPRPRAQFPLQVVKEDMGWCDDPRAANYNRLVRLPSRFGHETLRRDDGLYNLVIVIDYNFTRRTKHRGSAIFLHCARPDFAPTAGCIALAADTWRRLLSRLSRRAVVIVL